MKKSTKVILVFLLILSLLLTLGGCRKKETVAEKYADLIEDFVPDSLNVNELAVGEVDKPTAAVWTEANFFNLVKVSSTDESVVTASKDGEVTAVGEGSAYVIFAIELPIIGTVMSEIYRYDVTATLWDKYAADFVPNWYNTVTLQIGQQHTPTAAVWVQGGGKAYSSDDAVVTVDENGTVTAADIGTAYVVFIGSTGMYETYLYTVADDADLSIPEETVGALIDDSLAETEARTESDIIDFNDLLESAY